MIVKIYRFVNSHMFSIFFFSLHTLPPFRALITADAADYFLVLGNPKERERERTRKEMHVRKIG